MGLQSKVISEQFAEEINLVDHPIEFMDFSAALILRRYGVLQILLLFRTKMKILVFIASLLKIMITVQEN
jgi:hypothetical protein